jgi:hypothetical protein
MAMTTFSYVSTILTQVNITKPCLIGGLSTGLDSPLTDMGVRSWSASGPSIAIEDNFKDNEMDTSMLVK